VDHFDTRCAALRRRSAAARAPSSSTATSAGNVRRGARSAPLARPDLEHPRRLGRQDGDDRLRHFGSARKCCRAAAGTSARLPPPLSPPTITPPARRSRKEPVRWPETSGKSTTLVRDRGDQLDKPSWSTSGRLGAGRADDRPPRPGGGDEYAAARGRQGRRRRQQAVGHQVRHPVDPGRCCSSRAASWSTAWSAARSTARRCRTRSTRSSSSFTARRTGGPDGGRPARPRRLPALPGDGGRRAARGLGSTARLWGELPRC